MNKLSGKVALITGVSRKQGIGEVRSHGLLQKLGQMYLQLIIVLMMH